MRVTLITQERCDLCEQAKALLERLATDFSFELEAVDLATPEGRRLAESGGILFPPGIFIDDEPFSYGRPSERRLRRRLTRDG